jgi:AcrR family transcriptional regulator
MGTEHDGTVVMEGGMPEEEKPGRREELLRVAAELFSEKGFYGTSIRDIAKSLGVSVSVIYHHFENKEGLWSEIIDYSVRVLPHKLELALNGGGSATDRFRQLLRAHLEASAYYRKESKMFLVDINRLSVTGDAVAQDIQRRILDIYVQVIEELRREGFVKSAHAKIVAFNVLGVINWYLRWYRPDGPIPADRIYEEIISFVFYGAIGTPPGEC